MAIMQPKAGNGLTVAREGHYWSLVVIGQYWSRLVSILCTATATRIIKRNLLDGDNAAQSG